MKFSDHLKYLSEATSNEIEKERKFEPEVKDLLIKNKLKIEDGVSGEVSTKKLGNIKRIGEFEVTILPYAKGDATLDIGVVATDDEQGRVSLAFVNIEKLTKEKLDNVLNVAETVFKTLNSLKSIK